jgi:hypothetical protein
MSWLPVDELATCLDELATCLDELATCLDERPRPLMDWAESTLACRRNWRPAASPLSHWASSLYFPLVKIKYPA